MSYLSDVVGQAKQQAISQVKGVENSIVGGVRGAIANAQNDAANAVRGTVNNIAQVGVQSIVGAASSLISGNVGAAVSNIANIPGGLADAVVNGVLGKALTDPGSLFSASGSNGGGSVPGGDALAGALARADPMMAYCWYASMPIISPPQQMSTFGAALGGSAGNALGGALGGAIGGPLVAGFGSSVGKVLGAKLGSSASGASSTTELPWYYVESLEAPSRNFQQTEIFREGRDRKYPSKYTVDDMSLTIYLDAGNVALKYLQAWQDLVMSNFASGASATDGGGFGRPVNYKKSIKVFLLSVARQELALIEYTECWPTNLQALQLNSGSADRITAVVPFSVGDVFVNVLPVSATDVNAIAANPGLFASSIQGAVGGLVSQAANFGVTTAKKAISSLASSLF